MRQTQLNIFHMYVFLRLPTLLNSGAKNNHLMPTETDMPRLNHIECPQDEIKSVILYNDWWDKEHIRIGSNR